MIYNDNAVVIFATRWRVVSIKVNKSKFKLPRNRDQTKEINMNYSRRDKAKTEEQYDSHYVSIYDV